MCSHVVGYQSVPKKYRCKDKHAFSYNPDEEIFIYNCSWSEETQLPERIPNLANWVIYDNNDITDLCGTYHYLSDEEEGEYNVTILSIALSGVRRICNKCESKTLDTILTSHSLTLVDLSGNDFQPSEIFNSSMTRMGRTQILLAGNNTECDCSKLWMADWLNKSRTTHGKRLVKDYRDVTCSTVRPGFEVYKLSEVCFPPNPLHIWMPIIAGIIGGIILIILIFAGLIQRYKKHLRWLIYKHTGIFIGGGKERDDTSGMIYDAFLSYRYL